MLKIEDNSKLSKATKRKGSQNVATIDKIVAASIQKQSGLQRY